ncbi:uncharacterized protein LOC126687058 isoform X2 [Mercurialis annua]|uniref:uncharacterized protein LOC126687058 isoform X2 n=1 Tax=Mercurialis annua TaxID=3986 RepID=UPI00215E48F6|nr:uncharacterized protein LOC126687058 isoform X2 [Mercurialis annua]
MAIVAGNIVSKILFRRLISVSDVPLSNKRNATLILCLKNNRDYSASSSAVPVKYIPKESSNFSSKVDDSNNDNDYTISDQLNKFNHSLPTLKDFSKKNRAYSYDKCSDSSVSENEKARIRNRMYDKECLQSHNAKQQGLEEINIDMELVQHKFVEKTKKFNETHQRETDIFIENVQAGRTMLDAQKKAIELLATRAFTAVELRKKLYGKKFPLDIVDAVITDYQRRGLINDGLFAETFSQSKWSSLSWGPRRIKQELSRKGVSESDAEKAIKLVFEDDDSGGQESKHGMSKLSMERLVSQASKQWSRGNDVPKETRKARIIRWLQYRGFNWDVISFIVKKLESQYSS